MDKTQPPPTTPFVGRTEELALLQQTWDEVAAGEPRFLVWTADTGLGKTRLVQAFYEWLSTERHARDPHGYWPDALSISGRTLAVNPAFPASDGPRPDIPWLWWGLRFTDSKYERGIAASTCGLSNAREHLEPHLEPVIRARYGRELAASLAKANAGIWGGLLTGGLSGALFDGLGIFELNRKRRRLDAPLPGIATQQAEHWRDTVEEMLALFRAALGSGIPLAGAAGQTGKRPIPCALILDDAQWADVDTLRFIEPLFLDALRHRWPLLVLCTHWQQEWNTQLAAARTPNADNERRSVADVCERLATGRGGERGWLQVEPLPRLEQDALRELLTAALPGLTAEQAGALLERVGGNPGFLVDLVAYARTHARPFEGRDTARPLTESGARQLLKVARLDHHQLVRKRFDELDDALRQPLAMASYQGSRFLDDLLLETARRLDEPCSEQDLARARDPHAIVERVIPPALPPAASSSSAPGTRSRPKSWRRSTRTLMRPTPSAQPCVQSSPTGAPRAAWPHLTPATASSR